MAFISWQEIWDRFHFFNTSRRNEDPPHSITAPVEQAAGQNEYDVNFQNLTKMMGDTMGVPGMFGATDYTSWISTAETSKDTRTMIYREMEENSYVSEGLDEIVYSSLNADEKGEVIHLNVKNDGLNANENIRANLEREFRHIVDNVLEYKDNFFKWYREFVMMGEISLELLIDDNDASLRRNGVRGVKMLRSEEFFAYHDPSGNLQGFIVRNPWNNDARIVADRDQFAYSDSGKYDFVNGIGPMWAKKYLPEKGRTIRLVRSFIEEARKPYKQLDAIEDSLVIYRMARAPERLIFNVATGNLPKNKAEQYLQKIINKYRKKLTYNTQTGAIDQAQNVKNIMEDYWFIKDQTGKGTEVSTLSGASNLGEISDANYFLNKLYKAMKVPLERVNPEGGSVFDQNPGSMSRSEIKFEKFIYSILRLFVRAIRDVYITHLKLKGIWEHYELKEEDIEIKPVPPSYFTYMKNSEFLEAQFARFSNFSNNIDSEEPIFSKRMALKEGMGWDDNMIALNQKWLDDEKKAKAGEGEEGEEGDLGGELGGGDEEGGLGGDEGVDLGI